MKKSILGSFTRLRNFKALQFLIQYKLFGGAVVASLAALGLTFMGLTIVAHLILIAIVIIVAVPLAYGMIQDIRHGTYGVDILALTAIITSLLLGEYWTAAVIVLMLTGGESLEDYAERRSKRELDALLERAPTKAHVYRGRKLVDVAASNVRSGDRLLIKPGEIVPVDALIEDGSALFDESSLTGESIPAGKEPGQQILSGTINIDGAVTVRAIHSACDSQYQQVVRLVQHAAANQTPFVRLADRYSIPFTIIAFGIAGLAWFMSGDPVRFLQVIVVATPCPLILAAPIAIMSGMSRSSKQGIIVRTGSALERLAKIRTMAFDKTGTLTTGTLIVDTITTYGDHKKTDVLALAAAVESSSNHVLSRAIVEAATHLGIKTGKASHVHEIPGRGISARISGKRILIGRKSLLDEHDIAYPPHFRLGGVKQTAVYIAINDSLAGIITFSDTIRAETRATLDHLKNLGVTDFEMITGDNKVVASEVASQLGITQVTSEALPSDKLLAIESIKNRPVAFVGDGVNDAPVLTAADVGIALGARGSTAASESADIVIMVDDISRVAHALGIAKRTFKIARQSILVGIGLSVVLMVIFATGKFAPIYGALLQELVDIVVIFNALRAHSAGRASKQA